MLKILLCLLLVLASHSDACCQIRLGVLPFVSRSNEVSAAQASQVTEMVIRNLHSSPSILITERERLKTVAAEQGFNFSSGILNQDTASRIGSIIGCQYILFGAVTQIKERHITDSVLLASKALKETTAVIEARIIDVATRRIVLSASESGSYLEILKDRVFSPNTRRVAMEFAASRICDRVRIVLADEYPTIISVKRNKLRIMRINRGRNSGVSVGALYRVYQEGGELFDHNGRSLGRKTVSIAVIRVTDVQGEFSTAEVIKPSPGIKTSGKKKNASTENILPVLKLINEGDKVEIISLLEAEKIKLSPQRI